MKWKIRDWNENKYQTTRLPYTLQLGDYSGSDENGMEKKTTQNDG